MIETIITICALTMLSPYYDCSEKWNIVIYEEEYDHIPDTENAIGTAMYHSPFGKEIELVYNHQTAKGLHDHMLKGGGVLWHEVLHMYCGCNWHEYWDVEQPKRNHRFSNIELSLPDELKPFIKDKYHMR